uniref:Putative expression site-associated gene (ESAG) protein n=1 Tax=Trypanosoma congolense (strain IL3000) TaxID=1068625 RepID=G0UIZ8_TRYCI|nr:putative expression site-associated gene (ESAG) protein [Trypanosoma congolense IL3000]
MSRVPTTIRALLLSALIVLLCCGAAAGEEAGDVFQPRPTNFPPGDLKIGIDESVLTPFLPTAAKLLSKSMGGINISQSALSGMKLGPLEVRNISIGNMTVGMKAGKFSVSVWNMTAKVSEASFEYSPWYFPIFKGTARTEIKNANASFKIEVTAGEDGSPNVTVHDVVFQLLDLDVSPSLSGILSYLNPVVDLFKNIFFGIIVKDMQRNMLPMFEGILREKVEEVLGVFPIVLMESPNITDGRAELSLFILPNTNASRKVPRDSAITLAQPLPQRALSVVSSFAAANSVMQLLGNWGLLNVSVPFPAMYNSSLIEPIYPELHRLCPVCPLEISCEVTSDVWVAPANGHGFLFDMRGGGLKVNFMQAGDVPLTVMGTSVNTTANVTYFSIHNSTLNMRLESMNIRLTVLTSRIGELTSTRFNNDVHWLLNEVVLPTINKQTQGFDLPFKEVGISFNVTKHFMSIGLDPAPMYPLMSYFLNNTDEIAT